MTSSSKVIRCSYSNTMDTTQQESGTNYCNIQPYRRNSQISAGQKAADTGQKILHDSMCTKTRTKSMSTVQKSVHTVATWAGLGLGILIWTVVLCRLG